MKTNTPILVHTIFLAGCVTLTVIGMACAPNAVTVYSYENRILAEADSLFRVGNYEYAKVKYTKIRDDFSQASAGASAQYQLGYINIYFDNPFADYNAAMREFKRFTTHYPADKRVDMANSWIRILTVLQDFGKDYYGSANRLQQMSEKNSSIFRSYGTLQEAYLKCDAKVDSLHRRIGILEGIIAEIDKIR